MGNPSEMGGRRPGEKASNFSVTCRRLSQYLREKGSFGDLGLGMTAAAAGKRLEGKPDTPTTLNLLPGVGPTPASGDGLQVAGKDATADHSKVNPSQSMDLLLRRPGLGALSEKVPDLNREHQAAQMTIFYGGKVVVFDNFPPEKARQLMAMADRGFPAQISSVEPPQRPPCCPPPPAPHHPSPATDLASRSDTKPVSVTAAPAAAAAAAAAASVGEVAPNKPPLAAASEMPIARSVSLHRFLEKRKERITTKAPYPVNAPAVASASPDKEKGKVKGKGKGKEKEDGQWLGLAPQASRPGDSGGSRWPPAKAANSDIDPRGTH